MANRITVVLAFLLAALYLYATEQFPALQVSDPLGPKAFPRLLGIGLLLTALVLLAETLAAKKCRTPVAREAAAPRTNYWLVAAVVVSIALYFAVFDWLGYALSTSVFLAALMGYFRPGKWAGNVATAVLYSFGSYWVFSRLLAVSLPHGVLPF